MSITVSMSNVVSQTNERSSANRVSASESDAPKASTMTRAEPTKLGQDLAKMSSRLDETMAADKGSDVDIETADVTKNQILMQAGAAVLAQSNQLPASAMSLVSG